VKPSVERHRRRPPLRPAALAAAASALLLIAGCGPSDTEGRIAAAREHLAKQSPQSAVIELKSALQADADSGEARRLLGQALMDIGRPADAAVELEKSLALGQRDDAVLPLLARALLLSGEARKLVVAHGERELADTAANAEFKTTLARAYAVLGQGGEAEVAIAAALRSVPGHVPALVFQARQAAAAGRTDDALQRVEAILSSAPQDAPALLLKADLLAWAKNDLAAATAAARAALAAEPKSLEAHTAVVRLLLADPKLDAKTSQPLAEAVAAMNRAHPKAGEAILLDAQFKLAGGDPKAAREAIEPLMKIAPDDPRLLQLAGLSEMALRQWLPAEGFFARALQIDPQLPVARRALAQVALAGGHPQRALEALAPMLEAAARSPAAGDVALFALAGEAALQVGDTAGAERHFARAAVMAPANSSLRTAVAMARLAGRDAPAGAVAALEAAAAADRGARGDLMLIATRMRQGDADGALRAVAALEKKQPDRPLAPTLRARLHEQQKRVPQAVEAYERALAIDPKYFPAVAGLARISLAQGRPADAKQRFEALLAADPKHAQALLALAELSARTGGAKEEVARRIAEAVAANPTMPGARLMQVNHLLATGDSAGALGAAQAAAVALPDNADMLDAVGRAQLASGDHQQALSSFRRLAALRPTQPLAQVRLAEAQIAAADLAGAERSLARALELDAKLLPALRLRAQVALAQRRSDDALRHARAIQALAPGAASGHLLEADAERQKGRHEAAISALRAAQQRGGGAEAAVKLHDTLLAAGRGAEADKLATTWLAEHPKDTLFLFHLGDVALRAKDYTAAQARYRAVLAIEPKHALSLNNLAWIAVQKGQPDAVAMAEQAVSLLPRQPALLDTLATALAAERQWPRAIEVQRQAVALAPADPGLQLALAKIYLGSGDKARAKDVLEALARQPATFPGRDEVERLLKTV
jgi:putative PEP-CTERM system TPR-repeat lipoprotein